MATSNSVKVTNIGSSTSEKEIRDFFSFCGKISSLTTSEDGNTKSAEVVFEKESASRTALLLDGTLLSGNSVSVSAGQSSASATTSSATGHEHDDDDITQDDKPRSRIVAEYLAHGYKLGDQALSRAIELDSQHGISSKFLKTLSSIDEKYKATDKAAAVDSKLGVTEKATNAWLGLTSYFDKALNTQTGSRIHSFYTNNSKQVVDIHNEAVRLAGLKSGKTGSDGNHPTTVPGSTKTTCNCGGSTGSCPCAAGQCACSGCAKSSVAETGTSTTGNTDTIAASSNVAPLGEKN